MITNFNTKEYSPSVLEIFNSKPNWFIRFGTLLLFILMGILLFVSTLIEVQNNINVQLVFYQINGNNTIIDNSVEMKNYFNSQDPLYKLLQKQKTEKHKIYALMKSPVKISHKFKIGQTISLELPRLSTAKERIVKCTILSFDNDIFDNNQIVIVRLNSIFKDINKYKGKKNTAKIMMKKVTIFSKFKYKIKIL